MKYRIPASVALALVLAITGCSGGSTEEAEASQEAVEQKIETVSYLQVPVNTMTRREWSNSFLRSGSNSQIDLHPDAREELSKLEINPVPEDDRVTCPGDSEPRVTAVLARSDEDPAATREMTYGEALSAMTNITYVQMEERGASYVFAQTNDLGGGKFFRLTKQPMSGTLRIDVGVKPSEPDERTFYVYSSTAECG